MIQRCPQSNGYGALLLLLVCSLIVPVANASACETVEYSPSTSELRKDAINYFNQEAFVYEGILLGSHDFETGGRFLVLKSYKGPADPFDVIALPGGTSCYGGVAAFSAGIVTIEGGEFASFDGMVTDEHVNVWKERGLVASGMRSPTILIKMALVALMTILVGLTVFWYRHRRSNRYA